MRVELMYSSEEATYRFGRSHPMQPERFSLAVGLAESWGLLGAEGAVLLAPQQATETQLLTAHEAKYVAAVMRASDDPDGWRSEFGIGPGDTPAFPGMHQAAALAVGATTRSLQDVVSGD
jgi:acetoin utilization protein AcuC